MPFGCPSLLLQVDAHMLPISFEASGACDGDGGGVEGCEGSWAAQA